MPIKLANNASGTTATAISASDTGLALTTGDGAEFPTLGAGDYFYATLASSGGTQEIVKATARSGDSLTIVRAQEGTTAQSFAAGSRFELRVTAASVNDRADLAESEANAYALGLDTALRANLAAAGGAALVGNTPAGTIAANTVQGAINEIVADLAAANGSSLVGFQQAGLGAVPTTVQTKLRETVSVKDFGAVGDGVTDDTAAIQSTINSGAKNIYVPPGLYKITATINLSTTRDLTFQGAGRDATGFVTTITDGSPVFSITGQWHDIGEFKINSTTGSLQNFLGIQAGSVLAGTSFTRSRLRIKVANAALGSEVRGWINNLDIFTVFCTVGFKGNDLNSCVIDLRTENCIQGFDIKTCYGTTFNNLLDENTFSSGTTTVTNQFDDFQAVTINSIYVEGGSYSTTVMSFASTTASKGLTINQIQSTVSPLDRTDTILFDKVTGVEISGNIVAGGFRGCVGFSSNTRGVSPFVICPPGASTSTNSTNRLHDNSKQIRKAQNWFGDTYLDHGFNTFDLVTKSGVTTSIETSNVYTGQKAIRVEASTGGASRFLSLRRTVNRFPLVANLVGKTVKMFAWIYIPDLPKFADVTYQPAFEISVSGGASASSATQRNLLHNCWNLVETPAITVPAGWTGAVSDRFDITFYVNNTGTTVTDSGYYIIVDSIFITNGDVSILDIQRGNVEDYPLMGISSDSHNMRIVSNNYSGMTNADSATTLGDQVIYEAPTAGGFVGEVCTTAGAVGSTAVFKTFGAVSA